MRRKSNEKKEGDKKEKWIEKGFSRRKDLQDLLENEKQFKLQVFSLESIEIFEEYLDSIGIEYIKEFTSTVVVPRKKILLLLDDGGNIPNSSRMILYANTRNFTFVPYQFCLTLEEKELFVQSKILLESNKHSPVTSMLLNELDFAGYASISLNYLQSIIIMCLIRESSFKGICNEVSLVDPELENSLCIKCELNWLCKYKFCIKSGENYKINISHESVSKICDKLGFSMIFQ
ncbi:hypothetical protein GINT2_002359 [Glugoides intestinalis]